MVWQCFLKNIFVLIDCLVSLTYLKPMFHFPPMASIRKPKFFCFWGYGNEILPLKWVMVDSKHMYGALPKLLLGYQGTFFIWNVMSISMVCYFELLLIFTHFSPVFYFFNPWKCQKPKTYLTFSGGKRVKHWDKMG